MITSLIQRSLNSIGLRLSRIHSGLSSHEASTVKAVKPFTCVTPERLLGLMDSVGYIHHNHIPGAMVECGVWRGGCMMAVAKTLMALGDTSRELFLYDTFKGMSPPSRHDRLFDGTPADELLSTADRKNGASYWCIASLEDVRRNLLSTGYPANRLHFIQGMVEKTIPAHVPDSISLLRLDTDWYESTLHELEHLYERVSPRGVVILDDYGHWLGARKAFNEFISRHPFQPLLHRQDYTGRAFVKLL